MHCSPLPEINGANEAVICTEGVHKEKHRFYVAILLLKDPLFNNVTPVKGQDCINGSRSPLAGNNVSRGVFIFLRKDRVKR